MSDIGDFFYNGPAFILNTEREIRLQRLYQYLTYAHIFEGIPWQSDYNQLLSLHLKWAQAQPPDNKVIMLEPRLRPLPGMNEEDAAGKFMHVGNVCCRATFTSSQIGDNPYMISELTMIWFQDGFAWPIDPVVVEQIKVVDWNGQAIDVSFD